MRALSSFSATAGAVVILITSIIGCGSDSASTTAVANPDELFEQGPFEVGYREITISYDLTQDQLDVLRPDAGQDGCGPDFIDAREAGPVLAAYLLAFGRRHVLGQTEWDAVLTGPALGNEGDFIVRLK